MSKSQSNKPACLEMALAGIEVAPQPRRERIERMMLRTITLLLGCITGVPVLALEPFGFEPPPFLAGPRIDRASTGNTYSFQGTGARQSVQLRMTHVEIPAAAPHRDPGFCVEAFLAEIRTQAAQFYAAPSATPLVAGRRQFTASRWSGVLSRTPVTGVVGCAALGGTFVAITFQDAIRDAPDTFPAIRERLSRMELP